MENILPNNCRYYNSSSMNFVVCRHNWESNIVVPYDIAQAGAKITSINDITACVIKREGVGGSGWGDKSNKKNGDENCIRFLLL